jgi:hypothetical protein
MRRSLAYRIRIKLLYYINLVIGKFVDFLTRIGLFGKVPYKVVSHYGDAIEVTHFYPVNYDPADKEKFDEWKNYKTFPHDLFEVENVLLTSDGIVLQNHRTFIPALPHPVFRYQYGILYNLSVRCFYSRKQFPANKKYLLVYDNWSWNNYFHWVIDSLCRVQLLHEHVKENFTLIIPQEAPGYVTESLAYFGITDIVYLPKNSKTYLKNLYTMNYAAWSGQQHPAVLSGMVKHLLEKIPEVPGGNNRRVYVSRSRARSRKISNEHDVIALLVQLNFDVVYFEDLSFREQVALMQNTKYFVSSHGANMTNLIWMNNQNARILELLRNEGRPNFCYWSVASSLGHWYYYQLCPITAADNVEVDIAEFKRNLHQLLSE